MLMDNKKMKQKKLEKIVDVNVRTRTRGEKLTQKKVGGEEKKKKCC